MCLLKVMDVAVETWEKETLISLPFKSGKASWKK